MEASIVTSKKDVLKFKSLREVPMNWSSAFFERLIVKVYTAANIKLGEQQLDALIAGLLNDCIKYFPNLCLSDIEMALDKGVRGFYGDYSNLSLVQFNRWLKYYSDNEVCLSKKFNEGCDLVEQCEGDVHSADESCRFMEGALLKYYRSKGSLADFPINAYLEFTFKFLERSRLLVLSIDEKREIYNRVCGALSEKLTDGKGNEGVTKTKVVKSIFVNDFVVNVSCNEKNDYYVLNECYRIALERYFSKC